MIGKMIARLDSGIARLDSGLCRNDNGGVSYRLGKAVIPLENVILATPSFRQKPESDHFVIPAKTGIQWFMSSIPACRQAGMTTGMTTERGYPAKPAIHSPLGLPLLDSSFRWNDGGGWTGCPVCGERARLQGCRC